MSIRDEKRFMGDISQVFELKSYRYQGGRAEGVLASDLKNGDLAFTVVADRCMDLSYVSYKGVNISYISSCGPVAPTYYDARNAQWLRNFTAGLLTTCGLSNIGNPCTDDGDELGLHGRISNTPAEQYNAYIKNENDIPVACFEGRMREAALFNENLTLTRKITCEYQQPIIQLCDEVENHGYKSVPHMQLYHINFGYPFLDGNTELFIPAKKTEPRNDHALAHIDTWNKTCAPIDNFDEMCFYHTLKTDENNNTMVAIYSHTKEIGVAVEFTADTLDHFIEWKSMGSGNYVIGLEPANAYVDGRDKARADGDLKMIAPGDTYKTNLTMTFFSGKDALAEITAKINALK